MQRSHPLGPGHLALALLPMGLHAAFVQATLAPLAQGAAVVTLPTFERTLVGQTIASHRVTHLLRAPPQQGLVASRSA